MLGISGLLIDRSVPLARRPLSAAPVLCFNDDRRSCLEGGGGAGLGLKRPILVPAERDTFV